MLSKFLSLVSPRALGLLALGVVSSLALRRIRTALRGYAFAMPLVLMDVTRHHFLARIPVNTLLRVRRFPTAASTAVVRPNVDTLYSIAWIDAAEPLVLIIPPGRERYEVIQLMDAWTNVFFAPGTRLLGTNGGNFLICSPNWDGEAPEGVEIVRAPTRNVWLIGRTQTNGEEDYEPVWKLQDELQLVPLADYGKPASEVSDSEPGRLSESGVPPVEQLKTMSAVDFFATVAELLPDNPPNPMDFTALQELASLGVFPGDPFAPSQLDLPFLKAGTALAAKAFRVATNVSRAGKSGWSVPPMQIGNYEKLYALRSIVALIGLGANLPEDAVYPNGRVDDKGRPLDGSYKYRLRFPAGGLPPVRAFWSITAYGDNAFLIDNPANRYAVGSLRPLVFESDGSLELIIQADEPEERKENWLPVKKGEGFALTARLYWPEESVLRGEWEMPGVERLD